MSTLAKREQKRRMKRQERRASRITLANDPVGHGLQVPEPPDFGTPRFTPAQQAANPKEPMTRVIKDLCRAGSWKSGFGPDGKATYEQFDVPKLKQIVMNARAMMASGHAINLGKNHGDADLTIATDDLIAPIDEAVLDRNGVLWGSAYVTPEQADYLRNPARKVSVGLWRDYEAGDGQVYPGLSMLHVAVTDRPVVTGQGRFLALSNDVGPWRVERMSLSMGTLCQQCTQQANNATVALKSSTPATRDFSERAVAASAKGDSGKASRLHDKAAMEHVESSSEGTDAGAHRDAGLLHRTAATAHRNADSANAFNQAGASQLVGGMSNTLGPVMERAQEIARRITLGTFDEAKHARDKGKFTSEGIVRKGLKIAGKAAKIVKAVASSAMTPAPTLGEEPIVKAAASVGKKIAGAGFRAAKSGASAIASRLKGLRKSLKFQNEIMPRAITMANSLKGNQMADDTTDTTDGGGDDFSGLVDSINQLLAAVGVGAIPDSVTDIAGLKVLLQGVALAIGQGDDGDEPDPDDTGATGAVDTGAVDATGSALDGTNGNVKMTNAINKAVTKAVAPFVTGMSELKELLSGQVAKKGDDAKAKYMTFRTALGKEGVKEAALAAKDKLAEKLGWDPQVLEGLHPTITMQNVGRLAATTEAPALSTAKEVPTAISNEEMAKRLEARGIDPKFMPT